MKAQGSGPGVEDRQLDIFTWIDTESPVSHSWDIEGVRVESRCLSAVTLGRAGVVEK